MYEVQYVTCRDECCNWDDVMSGATGRKKYETIRTSMSRRFEDLDKAKGFSEIISKREDAYVKQIVQIIEV